MLNTLRSWHDEKDGTVLAATVMPDHVHVLYALGRKLTAGQCVGRWKSTLRRAINFTEEWQRDFWEHRLRPDEAAEDYAFYIFMNPYRAGLIPATAVWQRWWRPAAEPFGFERHLDSSGTPQPEWLSWPEERFAHLKTWE